MDAESRLQRAAGEAAGYVELIKMTMANGDDCSELRELAINVLSEALSDTIVDIEDDIYSKVVNLHSKLLNEVSNDRNNNQQ